VHKHVRSALTAALPIAVFAGLAIALYSADRLEREVRTREANALETARVSEYNAVFMLNDPAKALQFCREKWDAEAGVPLYQAPLALDWSRTALAGYFLDGTDAQTLREFRCSVREGSVRGLRVERPFRQDLPPPGTPEPEDASRDPIALALLKLPPAPDRVALEILVHPADQQPVVHEWRGERQLPPNMLLRRLARFPARNWIHEPLAALNHLATVLPADVKVASITIREASIDVTISGPVDAFDGDPPTPFGDMSYDDNGVAESTRFYPRETSHGSCSSGRAIQEISADFRSRFDQARVGEYLWFGYGCAEGSNAGEWRLKLPTSG